MQIDVYRIYGVFETYDFRRDLEAALKEAGIVTIAVLKDDEKVNKLALLIHDVMPPYVRLPIEMTIGKQGFIDFIFRVRDRVVERDRLDFSWLDLEEIKVLLLTKQQLNDVSSRVWVFKGNLADGRAFVFEFRGPRKDTAEAPFCTSYFIGRSADHCHIVIPDQRISRKHAELTYFPAEGLGIRDLKSTNGTFLNGQRVADSYQLLSTGSEVAFGELKMTVEIV